jgi:hypothetical protein
MHLHRSLKLISDESSNVKPGESTSESGIFDVLRLRVAELSISLIRGTFLSPCTVHILTSVHASDEAAQGCFRGPGPWIPSTQESSRVGYISSDI